MKGCKGVHWPVVFCVVAALLFAGGAAGQMTLTFPPYPDLVVGTDYTGSPVNILQISINVSYPFDLVNSGWNCNIPGVIINPPLLLQTRTTVDLLGTPTTPGTYRCQFHLDLRHLFAGPMFEPIIVQSADPAFTIRVKAGPPPPSELTISPDSPLPNAVVNQAYSATFTASGGSGDYSWSVSGGAPPGLGYIFLNPSPSITLSGKPTQSQTNPYIFTITVTDSKGNKFSKPYSLTVTPSAPLTITTASPLPNAKLGKPYDGVQFAATGGSPEYSWQLAGGTALPAGMSLSSTGLLSGPPKEIPTTNPVGFVVQATDTDGKQAQKSFQLKVVPDTRIHAVEITQAIQEFQPLDTLKADLTLFGEPPVPIIANKPGVIRVYMLPSVSVVPVEVRVTGATSGSKKISLQPQCTPMLAREKLQGCESVDFDITPPTGSWSVTVQVLDEDGTVLDSAPLTIKSRTTSQLTVYGVSVCIADDNCQGTSLLPSIGDMTEKLMPTASLRVIASADSFTLATAGFVEDSWWGKAAQMADAFASKVPLSGTLRVYGLVPSDVRNRFGHQIGGMAAGIPSSGAVGFVDAVTMAHEIGHTLGLSHTTKLTPAFNSQTNLGCTKSPGDSTDWPFANNFIQNSQGVPEVGFDVKAHSPVSPDSNFELMGYCSNSWISPFSYRKLISALNGDSVSTSVTASAAPETTPQATTGSFWTVSGTISGSTVTFDPLFQITATAGSTGTGKWQIQVQNNSGTPLYTRSFTPKTPPMEGTTGTTAPRPSTFAELIPVTAGATKIVVLNDAVAPVGTLSFSGIWPLVTVTAPSAGGTLSGRRTVSWTIADPDSSSFSSLVFYSANKGVTWNQVGNVTTNSMQVNFDLLPGSTNSSQIMVVVSDGPHSASAVSGLFSVPKKVPSATIFGPAPNAVFVKGDRVFFRGSIFDIDDGLLDASNMQWNSNLDGVLGTGPSISSSTLRSGSHIITMVGKDSDGNQVSATVPITIAGAGPNLILSMSGLNATPVSCVSANITASAGSVPLASADYSLDGGGTWTSIALNALPYSLAIKKAGHIHLIARVYDTAAQSAVKSSQFTIQLACGATASMSLSRSSLNFGLAGASVTSAQPVNVTFTGGALIPWTASSNQPNITVSPSSGVGNATLKVSAGLGPRGAVTVTSTAATNSPQQVQVRVAATFSPVAFGSFDTPSQNATGISGAVAVTGWALDPVEVSKVDIWRERIGNEPTSPNGMVYIGDAVFVPGARPDVESANPNVPMNYRAGWGYLMLTTGLPNNGGSTGAGNGTYTLHAIAHNASGGQVDLGTKIITVDNAHAARPFGSIDTPAQGATVSGNAYVNFGWALTQKPYCIPVDGSSITVTIDGVVQGHPSYNQTRSDIANSFPGLCNSNGAIGFFYIDTTQLTNGMHTIGWLVYDNQGRGDGIGSRFFNVFNSSIGSAAEPESSEPQQSLATAGAQSAEQIEIEELGRIELPVGAHSGYMLVREELRPLPAGSTLRDGVFYWQLGPGFLGSYELVFDQAGKGPAPHVSPCGQRSIQGGRQSRDSGYAIFFATESFYFTTRRMTYETPLAIVVPDAVCRHRADPADCHCADRSGERFLRILD